MSSKYIKEKEVAIDAVLKLIETEYSGPINVGSGVSSSVHDLCAHLEKLSGIPIADQGIPVSGHMEFCQDISLIRSIIDWEPQFDLSRGLERTFYEMQSYFEGRALG